ncbi:MAG: WxL domain-containing protein [Lactococcus hircilactis]|uniref:WxL domain-containing protein n=1 Tax=Lactococcus hircilactis TaxID=1494462 RepID=UPI003BBDD62E
MKKGFTLSAAALTALTVFATASAAFADTGAVTTPGETSATTQWTSNTGVTFNAPDDTTTLPDVTVPTVPPTTITPQSGALAIDYATDFDFGVNQIDGSTTDFKALTQADTTKSNSQASPLVAFHDLDGTNTSFTISATASGLSGLTSSVITLGATSFSNISGNDATDTTSLTDSASNHVLSNQPQVLVTSTGAVSGYYADQFADATLSVPVANQTAGNHTGTITWNLTVAP